MAQGFDDPEDIREILLRRVDRLDIARLNQRLSFWLAVAFLLNLAQSGVLAWLFFHR